MQPTRSHFPQMPTMVLQSYHLSATSSPPNSRNCSSSEASASIRCRRCRPNQSIQLPGHASFAAAALPSRLCRGAHGHALRRTRPPEFLSGRFWETGFVFTGRCTQFF
jgi:hypothetical protein